MAGAVEHRELLGDFVEGVVVELRPDDRVLERGDVDRGLEGAARDAFEEVDFPRSPVEHAAEAGAVAERPDDRRGLQAEDGLEFVEQLERVARRAVALVHEREDRHATAAADLEELARLRLDALRGVDDHERGVDRGEHAVGVLGEVLVARRVEQVHRKPAVVELQHG